MIVFDASFLFEALAGGEPPANLTRVLRDLPRPWFAPHLIDVELTQALRRSVRTGRISSEQGQQALLELAELPIERFPHLPFLPRVWEFREALTAYDALYVALAEALRAKLVTCDARLASVAANLVEVDLRAASPGPERA